MANIHAFIILGLVTVCHELKGKKHGLLDITAFDDPPQTGEGPGF
jgi:hypothetical protein